MQLPFPFRLMLFGVVPLLPGCGGSSSSPSYSPTRVATHGPRSEAPRRESGSSVRVVPAAVQTGGSVRAASRSRAVGRTTVVVDIDETLCIADYNNLLWGIGSDGTTVLPGAQAALADMAANYDIIYLTARSRSLVDKTQNWLMANGFPDAPIYTAPQLADFIFQSDFKRKALGGICSRHENVMIGIGDKVKDAEAYRTHGLLPVVVNPWPGQRYSEQDVVLQDWSAVADFFRTRHSVLSNPDRLRDALASGRAF